MSRLLIAMLALAGCADLGPFRASSSNESPDSGVGVVDGAVDGAGSSDANVGEPAAPEQIATTDGEALELAVVDGAVYWEELGSSDSVARMPVAGGQVKRLAVTETPYRIAIGGGLAFWTTSTSVMSSTTALTSATPIVSSDSIGASIAITPQHVYYARKVTSTWNLERVPRGGGSAEPLYTGLTSEPVFRGGTSSLFWIAGGELRRSAFTSPTTYSVEGTGLGVNLYVGGATACWVMQPDSNVYSYDVWCKRQGQNVLVSSGNSQIFDLAVADDAVYLATRLDTTTGRIRRYDFTTKQLTTPYTATTGNIPTELARDASHLYWVESQGVWRQALD